jgi:hypothetical protein
MPAPLIYDSGSAGLTLYAHAVFPPSMFDGSGHLKFPSQGNLVYEGITVTPRPVRREFGGRGGVTLYGYLGFAAIAFGDNFGQLSTSVMPFFVYDTTSSSITGSGFGDAQGIFGVDDLADEISLEATSTMLPACTMGNLPPCYVASVLKYLDYSPGIDAGFLLAPAGLKSCVVWPQNTCLPEPMLTVGLTQAVESGFSEVSLVCPPTPNETPAYYGPDIVEGYPVCEKSIAGGDIRITLASAYMPVSYPGPLLFDTGTVDNEIEDRSLASGVAEPLDTSVAISFPVSGSETFSYDYVIGISDNLPTQLLPSVNNGQNHIGVEFFEYNHFYIDYSNSKEGWKLD